MARHAASSEISHQAQRCQPAAVRPLRGQPMLAQQRSEASDGFELRRQPADAVAPAVAAARHSSGSGAARLLPLLLAFVWVKRPRPGPGLGQAKWSWLWCLPRDADAAPALDQLPDPVFADLSLAFVALKQAGGCCRVRLNHRVLSPNSSSRAQGTSSIERFGDAGFFAQVFTPQPLHERHRLFDQRTLGLRQSDAHDRDLARQARVFEVVVQDSAVRSQSSRLSLHVSLGMRARTCLVRAR